MMGCYVSTSICPFTGGGVPQSLVLSQGLGEGLGRGSGRGSSSLWFLVLSWGEGYPVRTPPLPVERTRTGYPPQSDMTHHGQVRSGWYTSRSQAGGLACFIYGFTLKGWVAQTGVLALPLTLCVTFTAYTLRMGKAMLLQVFVC